MVLNPPALPNRIPASRLLELAAQSAEKLRAVRSSVLMPDNQKSTPTLATGRLADLCGLTPDQVIYRASRGDLPAGRSGGGGDRRRWTVDEAAMWSRVHRQEYQRPVGARAVTLATGNFKGGVAKSTTAMTLAQGLALRGHRVLAVDTDPQGSLTNFFGLLPETDVDQDKTLLPLFAGTQLTAEYAVRSTYWPGIDLIPAAPMLYNAEMLLPSRQMKGEFGDDCTFYDLLRIGLEPLRDKYDVIIIDTSPSLGFCVMNAFAASDGLIVPMPPNALDFASSSQFWSLFADLMDNLRELGRAPEYDFVHILLTKVDGEDDNAPVVTRWIQSTYGEHVLPIEIPLTKVATRSGLEFGTIFDMSRNFKQAGAAYNRVVDLIEKSIVGAWNNQLADVRLAGGTVNEVVEAA
jgi:chromosome partitioning protein